MKKTTTLLALLAISGCSTTLGETEIHALKERAVADAKNSSESEHLAYLKCYANPSNEKKLCHLDIANSKARKSALTSGYIISYGHEAERLGFAAFIRNQGRDCDYINEGVTFNEESQAYRAICDGGNGYSLSFDSSNNSWEIKE